MKSSMYLLVSLCLMVVQVSGQQRTYCNPVNIDYGFTPIPDFSEAGRHRATADPVITLFKGDYYLFSTNQWGYWWSSDMYDWHFVPRKFLKPYHKVYDELCAPAVFVMGDTLFVIGSTYEKNFPIWMSTNPRTDTWKEVVDSFRAGAWDPAFFLDDDNRLYLYHGSSNTYPLYGQEIDRHTLQPKGERQDLIQLHDDEHGWERFGEYSDNNFMSPFMEGAWMNKQQGKYYLQYGAPGTEFSGYGDGVYISDYPLGPFTYQSHNPFSYKAGGFARGAGHGATFQDTHHRWWHVSTIVINVKNNFERRIGIWPAGFDSEGILYCNTAFGDYPHYLPDNTSAGQFTGWMLLNYQRPVAVSSTYGAFHANNAVDESIKTYWCAATAKAGEWIQTDLGKVSAVHAVQINYADQDADILGKRTDIYHQYRLWHSVDGRKWQLLVDKSRSKKDVPHDYIELGKPVHTRYIKLENVHMANGKFAISGLRVFGKGNGQPPAEVRKFMVLRQESDKRNAWLKWHPSADAYAYNVYYGISPDKSYTSIMVYGVNEYYLKTLDKNTSYYFSIEPINENGAGIRSSVIKIE
ncbi:discoidin domain-containing protein [Chitinophaga rhizophila]|uniref:Discoidin domain-containing protein n=1 Tax=Chitinophaga rhizophila TaxID=2866212 RepID=A0ABS7G934_9BACT|nr:discoidin domain-containing protein [Chitinophaga rhizophila]MBW8684177.1 discoidin domain-containing protein [Chitinophaga rhizophila]